MNYGLKKCPAVSSDLAILSKLNTRSGWGNIYRKPRLPVTLPSTSLISNKKRYNTWFPSKSIDFKYIKKTIWRSDFLGWISPFPPGVVYGRQQLLGQALRQLGRRFQRAPGERCGERCCRCCVWGCVVRLGELPKLQGFILGDFQADLGLYSYVVFIYIYIFSYMYIYTIHIYIYMLLYSLYIYYI